MSKKVQFCSSSLDGVTELDYSLRCTIEAKIS